jgi:hypothetical protein
VAEVRNYTSDDDVHFIPEQLNPKNSTYPEVVLPTNQRVEHDSKMTEEIISIL